jgi:glycosyltransferase involved in cell wall biosynthesis
MDRGQFEAFIVTGLDPGTGGSMVGEAEARGVPVLVEPSLVWPIRPSDDVRAIHSLSRLLRRTAPAVVHTHSSKAGVVGRVAARHAQVPAVVHTVHGWSFRPEQPALMRAAYAHIERRMARMTDALVVVAQKDADVGLDARIGVASQYHVIRSGIDIAAFHRSENEGVLVRAELTVPRSAPVVGWIGRFDPIKGPAAAVRVFARVRASVPDAHLIAVGDGPLRAACETLARELRVAEGSRFVGVRRDVPRFLSAVDLLILTSVSEGLPRVVVEAMAAGVPVVAFDVGGLGEVIEDGVTGYLVSPGDEVGLASVAEALLGDSEARSVLGQHALAATESFALEVCVEQTERLYRELLAGSQERAMRQAGSGKASREPSAG